MQISPQLSFHSKERKNSFNIPPRLVKLRYSNKFNLIIYYNSLASTPIIETKISAFIRFIHFSKILKHCIPTYSSLKQVSIPWYLGNDISYSASRAFGTNRPPRKWCFPENFWAQIFGAVRLISMSGWMDSTPEGPVSTSQPK